MRQLFIFGCIALLIMGCNNKADVPERIDVVTSGTATMQVTISLAFIDQLKELCTDAMAPVDFLSEASRRGAIAECVFNHMADLGKGAAVVDMCNKNDKTLEEEQICMALFPMEG